jgi:hypothetical protein
MDRGERRFRTEKIIARRVRRRREVFHRLYLDHPPEPWRSAHVFEVSVGPERRWTFHEWIAKPGVLRKHNGAHGACRICGCDESPKKNLPSLAWELENLALAELSQDAEPFGPTRKRRRHKDTRRWCRGKAGISHRATWRPAWPDSESRVFVCDFCGRKLDFCFHPRWPFSRRPCRCLQSLTGASRGPPWRSPSNRPWISHLCA